MDIVKRFIASDVVVRAVKTFLQAFLAVLVVGISGVTDVNGAKALVVAGVAAGLSALQNSLKELLK